jgi:hypothetical protein
MAPPWRYRGRGVTESALERMMEISDPILLPEDQLIVANTAAHTAVFSDGVVWSTTDN